MRPGASCRGQLAGFKVPRRVWIVEDVPRTPGPHGDKVQKARLREQALGALALESGAPGPSEA